MREKPLQPRGALGIRSHGLARSHERIRRQIGIGGEPIELVGQVAERPRREGHVQPIDGILSLGEARTELVRKPPRDPLRQGREAAQEHPVLKEFEDWIVPMKRLPSEGGLSKADRLTAVETEWVPRVQDASEQVKRRFMDLVAQHHPGGGKWVERRQEIARQLGVG